MPLATGNLQSNGSHGKRKPRVYLAACEAFDLPPTECMMVAAHTDDLVAAAKCGLRTGHVARPNEHGPGIGEAAPQAAVDVAAVNLEDLAAARRMRRTISMRRRMAAMAEHLRAIRQVLTEETRGKGPKYYLQNFHYQSGGWLTPESAQLLLRWSC